LRTIETAGNRAVLGLRGGSWHPQLVKRIVERLDTHHRSKGN
jgi:hypothetical protein